MNPGAWTHYAWSIRDALEIAALPAVEIHLSDVARREPWRRLSVIGELCFAHDRRARDRTGYRDGAVAAARAELEGEARSDGASAAADRVRRLARLRRRCASAELDALLVTRRSTLRYLTGFTGSNGLALVPADGGAGSLGPPHRS